MAIFVPALRLVMLFLNVYDSYKTLKPPTPSVRDPTRPSVRAMTQRKRDMKGCLAVWVVFCCFTSYERIVESLVSIFIPFYDEFKSMFMLFLIFTRARGAEPIFLHIVRPVIKPYTTTMDGTLELLRMTGDFLFALSAYPVHMGRAWWRRRFGPDIEAYDSDSETATTESTTHSREAAQHEVWVPPASAYNRDEDLIEDVDAPPEIVELTPEEKAVDEWRQYPAFPSAYPTSPLLTTSFFPPNAPSFGSAMQVGGSSYPPSVSASQQGFHRSLPSSRNTVNPSYADGSSDYTTQPTGFNQASGNPSTYGESHQIYSDEEDHHGDSMDEDYDPHHHSLFSGSEVGTDDEEDVFNMTLRTPLPPHGAARSRALMSRITIPLPAPLGSANSMSTTVPSARTSASTFRTASSRGSDPDSLEPSPTDGSGGLLSASSATLVPGSDAGLGLVIGDDLSKTLVEPKPQATAAAKKRKAVNGAGLLDLAESSDTGDNDEDEAEMDADGDDEVEEDGDEDVYIPSEQQEMKRRKVQVGKPGAAGVITTTSSKDPTQPRAAVRKPLAARQSDGQLRSTGTSSASQQAAKGHVKSASVSAVGKAKTSASVNATTTATKPGQARTGAPATRGARGGAKPTTNIGRGAAPSAMRGKVGSGVTKKSSTATLSAVSKTGSTGSNTSNDS